MIVRTFSLTIDIMGIIKPVTERIMSLYWIAGVVGGITMLVCALVFDRYGWPFRGNAIKI
jgi:hypothetical protein